MDTKVRAAEYCVVIDEILIDDKALRAQGIEGLSYSERAKIRGMLARIERRWAARPQARNSEAAE